MRNMIPLGSLRIIVKPKIHQNVLLKKGGRVQLEGKWEGKIEIAYGFALLKKNKNGKIEDC